MTRKRDKLPYADAENYCEKLSPVSHLATVHSKLENDHLATLIKNATHEKGWIGLRTDEPTGWAWVDQSPSGQFSNWAWGNPRGGRLDGDCASIDQIGKSNNLF